MSTTHRPTFDTPQDAVGWLRASGVTNLCSDSREVEATVDLRGLLPPGKDRLGVDVLNGIARDPADGSIWVTGKRWPWLYQIELVPVSSSGKVQ